MSYKNRKFPFIQQVGIMECGTTCLAMIFKYHGHPEITNLLTELAEGADERTNLFTLSQVAKIE